MMNLKTVLVATDFSTSSRHAVERAAQLCSETGAQLHLLHVLSAGALTRLQEFMGMDATVEKRLMDDAKDRLDSLAHKLTHGRGLAAEAHLVRGSIRDDIGSQAEAINADLLVVGARSQSVFHRLGLGSTAEVLLQRTLRPLLVVRKSAHATYRRVLIPMDFSTSSAAMIELARRIAPSAHLVLLHICEIPFEGKLRFVGIDDRSIDHYRSKAEQFAMQQLQLLADHAGLQPADWTPCILSGNASPHIIEQEQEQDCDLIVMGKHGQSLTGELLLGSVTRNVLHESLGDVLVSTLRQS